jgi:endo-1,3-1,4-beta-glycanase ExoK
MTTERTQHWRTAAGLAALLLGAACEHETESDGAATAENGEWPPAGNVAFVDHFETLNEELWMVADGWTNGDYHDTYFDERQVETGPEGLKLTLAPVEGEMKPYATGEIRTIGRYDRGYFEIDMKVPRGSGMVSGFFTYTGSAFGDPHHEIDIEILGRDTTSISLTIFYDGESHGVVLPLGFDAADDFHVYAFDWTDEHVRWYVDGSLVHEETGEDFPLPVAPQIYYLHLWNSSTLTDWLGPIDAAATPQTMEVRCMAQAPSYEGASLCRGPWREAENTLEPPPH